jgi:hypothetical protein
MQSQIQRVLEDYVEAATANTDCPDYGAAAEADDRQGKTMVEWPPKPPPPAAQPDEDVEVTIEVDLTP